MALRALRHRDFRLFMAGMLLSAIGSWMQSVAQSWLVYRLTGSAVLLGSVAFAGQIPVFVLSPLAGIVADRYPRRRVILMTQTAAMVGALGLALLTLTGAVRIWHIFVLSTLMGSVLAFDIPARQAFMVELVGRTDLMNAIALNSSMFNGARMIGPAIAGVLVATVGEGWCFLINSVSFLAVIASLLMMTVPAAIRADAPASALTSLKEGFRFVTGQAPVGALLAMMAVLSLTGMPFTVLMPIFADQVLHGGPRAMGVLMAASGVGALIGALLLAARRDLRGLGSLVAVAACGFGVALVVFACSRVFAVSTALLSAVGFAMMLEMGATNTLLQSMTPDALRGRVMAVYSMMLLGVAPLGALLAGLAASSIGAPATVGIGGGLCVVSGFVFASHLPRLRERGRALLLAQESSQAASPPAAPGEAVAAASTEPGPI